MSSRSFDYLVKGTVQGVNFRSWTVSQAQKIGITGYVRNDSTGDVSGHAEGTEDKLQQFAKLLEKGPSQAAVQKVEISNEQTIQQSKYSSFDQE